MSKIVTLLVIFLLSPMALASSALRPTTFLDVRGPCYVPAELQSKIDQDNFVLLATAKSVNGAGVAANVLFYAQGTHWLIVMQSNESSCVIVVGSDLDYHGI